MLNPRSDDVRSRRYDYVIVGSGAGAGTFLRGVADSGARILVIERGHFVPRQAARAGARSSFAHPEMPYREHEQWYTPRGSRLRTFACYHVGGATPFFGAALMRFDAADFTRPDAAWPIDLATLEPWYRRAETLHHVRGAPGGLPALAHGPQTSGFLDRIARGSPLSVVSNHLALKGGAGGCLKCARCDSYPCPISAKGDSETVSVRPALERENVDLLTGARVRRLVTDGSGTRVVAAEVEHGGESFLVHGDRFVLGTGTLQTPALLLRSRSASHPGGLANGSGAVGRHLMVKNVGMIFGALRRPVTDTFLKTWSLVDPRRPAGRGIAGMIQSLGRFDGEIYSALTHLPRILGRWLASHFLRCFAQTPAHPDPENRVQLTPDWRLHLTFRPNNRDAHDDTVDAGRAALRAAGSYSVFSVDATHPGGHDCGTARMGASRTDSVVDANCRTHDVDNLWIVDASVFPTQSAMNPALTIMANALRVAAHVTAHA